MKKGIKVLIFVTVLALVVFAACGNDDDDNGGGTAAAGAGEATSGTAAAATGPIDVISRESGSGTRDVFVEILGIEYDGVDRTTVEADIQLGTGAVITAVAGNDAAIGYISLGSVNDTIRAISINGVAATAANIQNETYPLFRNFNLAVPRDVSDLAQDFIDFILSAEGQAIVSEGGFIPIGDNQPAFTGGNLSGSLEIAGSTSVVSLMEQLANAYMEIADVNVEVHGGGTGAGISGAIEGRYAFGLASRELLESELESVNSVILAHDGMAVIVNNANAITNLSTEQVRDIFIGELTRWDDAN